MANQLHIDIMKKGVEEWNQWRQMNPDVSIELNGISFHHEFPNKMEYYHTPLMEGFNFSNINLNGSILRNGTYIDCCFDGSDINFADLVDAFFQECSFKNLSMRVGKIGSATFQNCIFENSDLSYCSAEDTNFKGSTFLKTKLEHMSFIANDFSNTIIEDCNVYGISSWDLNLDSSIQKNLIITREDQPTITADNLELSQFLYLIINNKRLRNIIDTITSKVVLILGNFSPDRKRILDLLRDKLREFNFIPVQFDFPKPTSRNLTETIFTLAHISKFVIADLSNPRSIGHELSAIVPRLQSVNIYPIITKNEIVYGMFEEYSGYAQMQPVKSYDEINILDVMKDIIDNESKK